MRPTIPKPLKLREAARLIGVTPATMRAYERRGKLRFTRLSQRTVLVELSEIKRLLVNGTKTLPSEPERTLPSEKHV